MENNIIYILQLCDEDIDLSNYFWEQEENKTWVVFIFLSIQTYQKGKTMHTFYLMKIPL